ncbi:hypothetical protein ACVC7O_06385 [Roseobacter sp. A03A-229]
MKKLPLRWHYCVYARFLFGTLAGTPLDRDKQICGFHAMRERCDICSPLPVDYRCLADGQTHRLSRPEIGAADGRHRHREGAANQSVLLRCGISIAFRINPARPGHIAKKRRNTACSTAKKLKAGKRPTFRKPGLFL